MHLGKYLVLCLWPSQWLSRTWPASTCKKFFTFVILGTSKKAIKKFKHIFSLFFIKCNLHPFGPHVTSWVNYETIKKIDLETDLVESLYILFPLVSDIVTTSSFWRKACKSQNSRSLFALIRRSFLRQRKNGSSFPRTKNGNSRFYLSCWVRTKCETELGVISFPRELLNVIKML